MVGKHHQSPSTLPAASVAVPILFMLAVTSGLAFAEEVSVRAVETAAEEYLLSVFSGEGDVVVDLGEIPALGDLEGRDLEIRTRLLRKADTEGPLLVSVEFWHDGSRQGQRSLSAEIRVYREVLVAAERLDRHTQLTREMFALEKRDVRTLGREAFASEAEVLGKRTRRLIPTGRVIRASEVEAVPVVARGQKVQAVVVIGWITVSATATALEDGIAGQVISVKNDRSGKRLRGIVVGEGVVRVEIGSV